MKRCLVILTVAVLALCSAFPAMAAENGMIRVSGHATVTLSADTAVIQVGVNTRKATVREAQTENNSLMNGVIAAILEAGVNEKDIMDMNVNMSTLEAILKKDGMIHDLEMNKTKEVTK